MNIIMQNVESYISKDGEYDIDKDDNLFEKGLLDSMGIIEVISIIEDISGKDLDPELIIMENFKTLNLINQFISKEIND